MKAPWILRYAAWLAPAEERVEWLAEWVAEAAYVRGTRDRGRAIAFCLGAFPDALWLRRNRMPREPRRMFSLESPMRCLLLLAVLATASVCFAFRRAGAIDALPAASYRDPERLAMISHRGGTPRFAEIPVEEYRLLADGNRVGIEEVAFYTRRTVWVHSKQVVIAVASPNLFELLGVPISGAGLILSKSAWRRYFNGDRNIVGQLVEIDGARAAVAGVVSDGSWRLPGAADAWLLDASRLAALPPESRGFMVARLRTAAAETNLRWLISVPNDRETFDALGVAPLPRDHSMLTLFIFVAGALLFLSATTSLSLGEYPAARYSPPWATRVRRWMFLGVKVVLLLFILVCGLFGLAMLFPPTAQGMLFCAILALRWALEDQRNRCPVCLRSLSHPVRIGEASHTFLAWYGTELLCVRGHGMLHVPDIRTSCYAEQRWLYL